MASANNEAVGAAAGSMGANVDFQVTRTADGQIQLPPARDEGAPAFTAWYMGVLGLDYDDDGAAS